MHHRLLLVLITQYALFAFCGSLAMAEPDDTPIPVEALMSPRIPLHVRNAICVAPANGAVLYTRNADERAYPASTTKILTALLILERGGLETPVRIVPEDTRVQRTSLDLRVGTDVTRDTLLRGMLIHSANDAALAIARDHSGSVAAFSTAMNERARQLGAKSSHFTNPHGLHDSEHYTTARDLARITLAALAIPRFREIVSSPEWIVDVGNGPVMLRNSNHLLREFPGAFGVKTGFTKAAQTVLVSAARRGTSEVVAVAMRSPLPTLWEDSKTLLLYGFSRLGAPPG
jgi:D-alanyl-D-alanine carboxypeptidase (penicillin-binding protein 5/6)